MFPRCAMLLMKYSSLRKGTEKMGGGQEEVTGVCMIEIHYICVQKCQNETYYE